MDTPKPSDFPIGSAASRAAARMLVANREDTRVLITVVSHIHRPWRGEDSETEGWNKEPCIGPWQDCGDTRMRVMYLPGRNDC